MPSWVWISFAVLIVGSLLLGGLRSALSMSFSIAKVLIAIWLIWLVIVMITWGFKAIFGTIPVDQFYMLLR